jgi:3-hydroxyisobutyrate dehydrogenase-like beta-hydroxyacid dehydrogenase
MGDAVVGIIGMGDMGKMYARRISDAGWKYVGLSLLCLAEEAMVRFNTLFLPLVSAMMT